MPPRAVQILPSPVDGVFATYTTSGQFFRRHWHDAYNFGLLDRGAQRWRSRRGIVDAYAGAVINNVPGEVHDGRPIGGESRKWRMLSVDPRVMTRCLGDPGTEVEIGHPVIQDLPLALAIQRLFDTLDRWHNGGRGDIDALAFNETLTECCALLVSRHGTIPIPVATADRDVSVVRDRLADDPSRAPSLAELAAIVGLSRFQLLRRFKTMYGLPPHAWLLSRRAERARELIRGGEALSRAAFRSGFADQSHMTRTFAKLYGYTPGRLQAATHRTRRAASP